MSTRAHIRIKDGDEQIMLYHHHDGYPEGVGRDLKKFLQENCQNYWDACEIANGLVKGGIKHEHKGLYSGNVEVRADDEYEITTCIHGDEEFIYVIDCDKKELKCYTHKWDAPFSESTVPERECTIPEPKKEEDKA